jgi:hypothetical protein
MEAMGKGRKQKGALRFSVFCAYSMFIMGKVVNCALRVFTFTHVYTIP